MQVGRYSSIAGAIAALGGTLYDIYSNMLYGNDGRGNVRIGDTQDGRCLGRREKPIDGCGRDWPCDA